MGGRILFYDKHRIIWARFRVIHRRPRRKVYDLGAPYISLSYNFALLNSSVPSLIFV
jgi:hypothetical protein